MGVASTSLTRAYRRATSLTVAAGLALLLLCVGGASIGHGHAQGRVVSASDPQRTFASAARRWNVPVQIVMAVGYVESRWEQRDGTPSTDQGYGIMHIVDRPDGTMERATNLTGLTSEAIRRFPEANIEAGAALLSDISHKSKNQAPSQTELADWYPAVSAYSGATDPNVRDAYAQEVFRVVREGAHERLTSGESVELPPTQVKNVPVPFAGVPLSDDYPGALWTPANGSNYQVGRPYPPIDTLIIHDTEGSYASAISWFQNPSAGASAHYVIRSSDGQITQMVREANTAYQAGNWDYNVRAIGIEHEGFMNQQGWYTEAMYQSSAALARSITERYGIRKDRAHIIGHYQVPNQSHVDPGPNWNWPYYMSLVRRDSERAALVDNTDPGFVPIPSQIDPQHYWWTYSGGYSGSNTYATSSVTYQSSSINSATWSTRLATDGYYDLYAFVPYVDNQTPDTSSAKYQVTAVDGVHQAIVSQKAITDVGSGSWANLGKFYFNNSQDAVVSLSDWTGETGKNVWFDAVMWIPSIGGQPPPTPGATSTPPNPPPATDTPTQVPTSTPAPTWTPGPCGMRFIDLPDDYWAYNYISDLFCRGVVSGYDDGTFRPYNGSTRGQFAKMLVLGMSWVPYDPLYPDFNDVPVGSTFYSYVETAFQHGTVSGYEDGTFRPNNSVTRAQVAKMLVIGAGWTIFTPSTPTFSDVPSSYWAFSYIETAFAHGIIAGFADGGFHPDQPVTRAQLAKMVDLATQLARGPHMPMSVPSPTSSDPRPERTIPPKPTLPAP
jgi:hypothetical protein